MDVTERNRLIAEVFAGLAALLFGLLARRYRINISGLLRSPSIVLSRGVLRTSSPPGNSDLSRSPPALDPTSSLGTTSSV